MSGPRRAGLVRYVPPALVLLLITSIGLLATIAATRPVRLDEAVPADRDRLAAPPLSVRLSFTAPLDAAQTHVVVVDSSGAPVDSDRERVSGATVTQPVVIAGAGGYQVAYHATFGDGRQLAGVLTFTVGGSGAAPTGPSSTPPSVRPPSGALPPASPPAAAAAHQHGVADPVTMVILAIDAVLVVVAGLVVLRRKRRPRSTRGRDRDSADLSTSTSESGAT